MGRINGDRRDVGAVDPVRAIEQIGDVEIEGQRFCMRRPVLQAEIDIVLSIAKRAFWAA